MLKYQNDEKMRSIFQYYYGEDRDQFKSKEKKFILKINQSFQNHGEMSLPCISGINASF